MDKPMRDMIGKFKIIKELGHGAMGTVFLGEDGTIGRQVAIKTIRADSALGAESKRRFFREAQACGTLNHPNIVTIYDFGEEDGLLFLAMEYIPGKDLQELFQTGESDPQELLELFAQICDGLQHAHEQGVIHRDIKPSNIRVTRTPRGVRAKIVDFGVARTTNSDLTNSGIIMGTVSYLAPEYIDSGEATHLSDLFSLGVMAYEGLTGRRPFQGDSSATVLLRILNAPVPPLSGSEIKGLSPGIQGVLQKALAKRPADRIQSAEALSAAFRQARDPGWRGMPSETGEPAMGSEGETKPLSAPRNTQTASPFGKTYALAGGVLLLVAVVGGVALVRGRGKSVASPPKAAETVPLPPSPTAAKVEPAQSEPQPKSVVTEAKPKPPGSRELEIKKIGESALQENPAQAVEKLRGLTRQYPDQPSIYAIYIIVLIKNQKFNEVDRVRAEAGTHGITLEQMKKAYPQLAESLSQLTKPSDPIKVQGEAALRGDPIKAVETLKNLAGQNPDHQEIQAMYLTALVRTRKTTEFDRMRADLKARGKTLEALKRAYPPLAEVLLLPP